MVLVRCPHTGTTMHAHIMVCNKKNSKNTHNKAKITHSLSHIYTVLCKHAHKLTLKGQIHVKCTHFFWDKHQTATHADHSQDH